MRPLPAVLAGGLGRVFTSFRLLMVFTAANLILALLAVFPTAHALGQLLGPAGGDERLRGWPVWLEAEVHIRAALALEALPSQAGLAVLSAVVLSAFLTGGALAVLHDADGGFSLAALGRGGGRYGPRLLRLLVLFLGSVWILRWIVGEQLGVVVDWLQFDWPDQRLPVLLDVAHQGLLVTLFYLLTWLFDLARVRLVVDKRRSALGALLAALGLMLRQPAGAAGLFMILAAGQTATLLAAGALLARVPAESTAGLLVFCLLAQAIMAVRFAFRLAYLECGRRWILSLEGIC